MMTKIPHPLFFLGGFLVFIIDVLTPLGYAPWVLYVVLLFLYTTYTDKKYIFALTALYSVLLIPGFYLSPPIQTNYYIPIINRIAAAIIMVLLAILGIREAAVKKISSEILDRVKDLFFAVDKKFRVTFFNRSAIKISGIKENIIGKDIYDCFPVLRDEMVQSKVQQALNTQQPVQFQYTIPNTHNVLDVNLYTSEKGISVFARDITERVKAEKKLVSLLHEKEMLMKEMYHRTKNNFQLVLSLLNLQINSIQDDIAIRILNETRARLLSITILYEKLFRKGNIYTINLKEFISDIISNMETAVNFGMTKINNEVIIEENRINIEAAIPIGLIINELYTNSLKYAFNGGTGSVLIEMKFLDQNTLYIKYRDDGKGLPEDYNINSSGLGSSIISGFVAQLDGQIIYKNNNGAEFEIKLRVIQNQQTVEIPKPEIESLANSGN